MEEPNNRFKSEMTAKEAKVEADRLAKQLGLTIPVRKQHGDSALGPDGRIDYSTAPDVQAPSGLKPDITIVNNCWNVKLVPRTEK